MIDWKNEKYVSLRTFRRNGTPVETPVWIVELASGELAFTTDPTSFKVRRISNNAAVELRPCSMRGNIADGAEVVAGTARAIGGGSEYNDVVKRLKKKYGFQVTLIEFGGRIKQAVKRNASPDCAVIISIG